jgi:hypothetical protein
LRFQQPCLAPPVQIVDPVGRARTVLQLGEQINKRPGEVPPSRSTYL